VSDEETPAQRKTEARRQAERLVAFCRPEAELPASMAIIDAHARACIDEAVAPALVEYARTIRGVHVANGMPTIAIDELIKLLTERAET
jgi:hypothetical protein